tara:strand:- start:139 stop:510 length:372 start_codon:yes stop_codon:yes gene_type:complete
MNFPIKISAEVSYVEEHSDPMNNRYVFAYTITISNGGESSTTLISRHWVITDANDNVEEVKGDGVVGEQPTIKPSEGFQYTSGAIIQTSVGTMEGSYTMITEAGETFEAKIPQFVLAAPGSLN